jgi:uncharacterized membrane protein YjfL (UPF0719 family)
MSDQLIGLICGIVHLVLSLVLALLATFGSFRIFDKLTRNIEEVDELKANNVSVSIVLAGMLLSSAIILKTVIHPAISTLQTYLYQGVTWISLLKAVGFISGYIVLALALAIAAIWLAMRCFLVLTRNLDELGEIKKDNTAVAIMLSTVIVIMGLFLAGGIDSLMKALIPFPAFEGIQVVTR